MRKFLLSLLILLLSVSAYARNGSAAPSSERTISSSQYDAMAAAYPEVKTADDELQNIYTETREIIGEEGGGGVWLAEEQMTMEGARKILAFQKGEVGTPAFVRIYLDQTQKRIEELHTIAAKGRIIERQIYDRSSKPDGYLGIWKYERDKAQADVGTFIDYKGTSSVRCTIDYTALRNPDGTWSGHMPDFSDVAVDIAPGIVDDFEGYDAHVTKSGVIDCLFHTAKGKNATAPFEAADFRSMRIKITSDEGEHYTTIETENVDIYRAKGIVPLEGTFRRTNKVPRPDDPTLEEVAACTLGKDRSQTVRIMRNRNEYDENIYYFKTSQGLFSFSSFGYPKLYGSSDEVELSRGLSLSPTCDGDAQERIMVAVGEFSGNSVQIRVIRYNSAHGEWQIINAAESMPPTRIYLNDTEMKILIPHPFDPMFTIYSIKKGKIQRVEQKTIPAPKGYRVIPITENDLNEGKIP